MGSRFSLAPARISRRSTQSSPEKKGKKHGRASRSQQARPHVTTVDIDLGDTGPPIATIEFSTVGQHTITWTTAIDESPDNDISGIDDGLPEGGSCNLYIFPTIKTPREPRGERPSYAGIRLLKRILIFLAENTECFEEPDEVGAFPIHALVVCNTPESLELSMELFARVPALLKQVHVKHRAGIPLFCGESSLHICAVNKREVEFVRIVDLAQSKLPVEEVKGLFLSQAEGLFFQSPPVAHYGGSALAYACVFGMKGSISKLLASGHVSFNDRSEACRVSGFLPLHAIVANGCMDMYNFVTMEVPHEMRADTTQVTKLGMRTDLRSLTSLQLAASLGLHSMFRIILRQQCEILWVWGPLTQFSINLKGIDSAGAGGGDIMELITRIGASRSTTSMLLDNFMNGFIYRLYLQKWKLFGRKLYLLRRSLDVLMLVLLVVFSLALKGTRERQYQHYVLAGLMLTLMAVIVEEEIRNAYLFARNQQGENDVRISKRETFKLAWQFCKLHAVHVQLFGLLFVLFACLAFLLAPPSWFGPPSPFVFSEETLTNEWVESILNGTQTSRRVLRAAGGGDESGSTVQDIIIWSEGFWNVMWMSLTTAQLSLMMHFAYVVFQPFESLNILLLSVISMLKNDVILFMIVWLWVILAFTIALFTLYPRSGVNDFPLAESFNDIVTAMQAVFELGFIGESVRLSIEPLKGYQMDAGMWVSCFYWVFLYLFLIVMTLILLINLLIAMLTHTYDAVRDESLLLSRLSFAQCLLKLELVADSFNMRTHVGKKVGPDTFVYEFRSLQRDGEDDEGSDDGYYGDIDAGNGADPFQDPAPSAVAKVQASLTSLSVVIANNQKLLIQAAKGDMSWVDDPHVDPTAKKDEVAIPDKPTTSER